MKEKQPIFSVIIPTLNEENHIAACLDAIFASNSNVEAIVVDAGSSDNTTAIAGQFGIRILHSVKNRGRQCNQGVAKARGEILFFLYADSIIDPEAFDIIERAFLDKSIEIATFRLKLSKKHWILSWYAFCARFDSVLTKFGDQGIVVRKSFFEKISGFPQWPLFDDTALLQKARRHTKLKLLDAYIINSDRKFVKNGIVRQYFFDAFLMLQYLLGVSPERLAKKYY